MEIDRSLSSWWPGDLDCDYNSMECIDIGGQAACSGLFLLGSL